MRNNEIKENIVNITSDVFRDTHVLCAYIYGSQAVDQAHRSSGLDIGIYVPRLTQREKHDLKMAMALEIYKKLKQGPVSNVRWMNI